MADPKQRMTIAQIRQHPFFLEGGPPVQLNGKSELGNVTDGISQVQIQPSEAEVASAVQVYQNMEAFFISSSITAYMPFLF